jgi:hypothetical protein
VLDKIVPRGKYRRYDASPEDSTFLYLISVELTIVWLSTLIYGRHT